MSAKIYAITAVSDQIAGIAPKLDYLKELSGGDHNFIAEILEMFITEAPQSVEQSFRYLQEKNFEMLRITVHKLKSSVQVVGGYHLTNLIHEIESASKETERHEILPMLSILKSGIQHMVNHLCTELKSFSSTKDAA